MKTLQSKTLAKLYGLLFAILLAGCGHSSAADKTFIVSGQSNAMRCDWTYFTEQTGYQVHNIAKPGTAIQQHIDEYYHPEIQSMDVAGVIFVNGGADAKIETRPGAYIKKLTRYRRLIHHDAGKKVPFIISNIGYNSDYPDRHFNLLRSAINDKVGWIIAFNGAQYFRDLGMLVDETHYSEEGCKLMMDAIITLGVPVAVIRNNAQTQ